MTEEQTDRETNNQTNEQTDREINNQTDMARESMYVQTG